MNLVVLDVLIVLLRLLAMRVKVLIMNIWGLVILNAQKTTTSPNQEIKSVNLVMTDVKNVQLMHTQPALNAEVDLSSKTVTLV